MPRRARPLPVALSLALLLSAGSGCSSIVSAATGRLTESLSTSVLNQDDPDTVRDGAPAFLLMVDGFIESDPDSSAMLLTGASLYGAYAGAFVEDPEREQKMTRRALGYAKRALCIEDARLCEATGKPFDEFTSVLAETGSGDLPVLYGFGSAWAGWVQSYSSDWNAVAELPKVEAVMLRIVELDDAYEDGMPHLYLGVLNTIRPPSVGGRPEVARAHFERAIELSEGRNLMAKVYFAERYARLVFDQQLHDRLLREALAADPVAPGLTLSNILAQEQARTLLEESSEYF